MRTLALAASLVLLAPAALALAGDSKPAPAANLAPHPHFNDGGTLPWSTKLADAQAAAKKSGKLIFIEYGREG